MNIGACYSELSSPKAMGFFNKALIGFRAISDSRNEFFCMGRIGKYYYKIKDYTKATPCLKKSFDYMYANLPHISLEIFTFYLNSLQKQNCFSEIKELLALDAATMLAEANLQEKIFYYETLATLYGKFGDKPAEYLALKSLQTLYAERQKENTFEELQKKLNQYNLKNEVTKNKNLELKLANLKLQNFIITISIILLLVLVFFVTDKQKKKNKIQKLVLLQLKQERVMHEKSAELKDLQLQLESEIKYAKERELTALQLRIFEMKEKVIELLKSNELKNIDDQAIEKLVNNVNGCFENEDYWKEFQFRFTNMHPTFSAEVTRFCPKLTKKDIDFLTLIKLNLNNKEIATLISISYESVISKRYLLRKKMGFYSDNDLINFLETL